MAGFYYISLTLELLIGLENKRKKKALSPTVAFLISPGCRRVLSTPAIKHGEEYTWFHPYTLMCEERYYQDATLTIILFHKGKKHDKILGVAEIPVSSLTARRRHQLPVLNESGMHNGGFLRFYATVVPPPTRSFTVIVHRAQDLKNVKWLWKRISLRSLCVRKMKPYVVVESNLDNELPWISPIARKDGRNHEFKFRHTFTCNESLIQQDRASCTIELRHRHKAEVNNGTSAEDRAKDIMIGTVEIKVSEMEQRRRGHHVRTPTGKLGGKLYVSVLGEPEQQEQEALTPSPWNTSWMLRIQRGDPGVKKFAGLLFKYFSPVPLISAGTALAAVV